MTHVFISDHQLVVAHHAVFLPGRCLSLLDDDGPVELCETQLEQIMFGFDSTCSSILLICQ